MFLLGLFIGSLIGGIIGVFVISLLSICSDNKESNKDTDTKK